MKSGIKPVNRGQVGDVVMMLSTDTVGWSNPEKYRTRLDFTKGDKSITFTLPPTEFQSYLLHLPKEMGKKGDVMVLDDFGYLVWKPCGSEKNECQEVEKRIESKIRELEEMEKRIEAKVRDLEEVEKRIENSVKELLEAKKKKK